jgi:hypothetical protein
LEPIDGTAEERKTALITEAANTISFYHKACDVHSIGRLGIIDVKIPEGTPTTPLENTLVAKKSAAITH